MAITKFLARDITFEVGNGASPEVFLPIGGLQTITHAPASTNADTTDFDSNGHARHLVAQRGDAFTLAGQALEDVENGDRDPGQARCEVLAKLIGLDGMGNFRITSPGGNTKMFAGSCVVTGESGGTNDAATWQCAVTVDGEVTDG